METSSRKRRDFVLRLGKLLSVAGATSFAPQVFANGRSAKIKSVALKQGFNGHQKLVFELDKSVRHKLQTYKSPDRIVIDFLDTQSKQKLQLGRNAANSDWVAALDRCGTSWQLWRHDLVTGNSHSTHWLRLRCAVRRLRADHAGADVSSNS